MTRTAPQAIATIDQFLSAVGESVKTASEKVADGKTPLSEPGSIGGETSHPVKNVEDRLWPAKEGERSTENKKDVKEDQGAPSVENAADAKAKTAASVFDVASRFAKAAEGGAVSSPGSAADDHMQIGTKVAPTGEDPSNETKKAKGGKDDPGSSHPARTDNDSLDGHKYAADTPLEKLAADMRAAGNSLVASINAIYQGAGVSPPAAPAVKTAAAQPQFDHRLAATVGWEMAGLIDGSMDKRAADAMVQGALSEIVKEAAEDADMYIEFARSYFGKQAEGEEPPPEGGGPGGEGGPPSGAGGGEDEAAMMASLGGGEGGGDPSMGGGGEIDPETMQLAQMLAQLNITPEKIEQMMAGGGMGGGDPGMGGGDPGMGGPPPGAGGAPPGAGGPPPGAGGPPPGMEVQASVSNSHRAKEAMAFIREVYNRSKKK